MNLDDDPIFISDEYILNNFLWDLFKKGWRQRENRKIVSSANKQM